MLEPVVQLVNEVKKQDVLPEAPKIVKEEVKIADPEPVSAPSINMNSFMAAYQ